MTDLHADQLALDLDGLAAGRLIRDQALDGPGQARTSDPPTSHAAAAKVGRKGSARRRLLEAHDRHAHLAPLTYRAAGLTDEEAAIAADLSLVSEYATRCSELRRMGALEQLEQHRAGAAGAQRMASRITAHGRQLLDA